MAKVELVMIVTPAIGHLPPALELAKLMIQRNNELSITFLIMEAPFDPKGTAKIRSLMATCNVDGLRFHVLPASEDIPEWNTQTSRVSLFLKLIYSQKHVRETVSRIKGFSGIIVDLMSTTMIDVAEELGVPSYVFYTSSAACLGLMLHFQTLEDEHSIHTYDLASNEAELVIPSFANRVPTSILPRFTVRKDIWSSTISKITRDYRRAKGVIVNTFEDLENYAIDSLSLSSCYGSESGAPPIYLILSGQLLTSLNSRQNLIKNIQK